MVVVSTKRFTTQKKTSKQKTHREKLHAMLSSYLTMRTNFFILLNFSLIMDAFVLCDYPV